jgi:N6-adenosine-specific RNA methylase IME4
MIRDKCILLDPPWEEYGGGARGAQNHYSLMSLSGIAKTILSASWRSIDPVFMPAPDCHLWCWATDNYLLDALSLIDRLGFRYIRTIVWVKIKDAHLEDEWWELPAVGPTAIIDWIIEPNLQIGLGQYARGSHELLLFATRGKAMVPAPENRPPSVIFAPRQDHSRKPDQSYELIERISPGPRLEMFARSARPGWRVWGNEAPTDETPIQGERDGQEEREEAESSDRQEVRDRDR